MGKAEDFGWGVASNLTGNIISGGFNTLGSLLNYHFNEKAANNADTRQRKMYYDLHSPKATLKQLKAAGLSPSMMFGGTPSAGGVSAPQGAGAMGASFNSNPIDMLSSAQVDAIKEETRGKKIENDNKQAAIDADIALKLSQAGLNKASEAYTNVKKDREAIALEIDSATTEDKKKEIRSRANNMYWQSWLTAYECKSARAQAQVDEATIKTRIATEVAENQKIISSIAVDVSTIAKNKSSIAVDQATIENMIADIAIKAYNANTDRMSYEAQKKWYRDQIINQLTNIYKDLSISAEQLETYEQGQWLNFATDIFGSICNVISGGIIAGAKGSK